MKREWGACLWILLVVLGAQAEMRHIDSSFAVVMDSLFGLESDSQQTRVKIVNAGHTYFLVTTCKTLQVPFEQVAAALEAVERYKDYFGFMKRSGFVNAPHLGDSLALFEAGVAWYVAWYAGYIRMVENPGQRTRRYLCGNLDQRLFKKEWEGTIGGLIRIRSHDVSIEWRIQERAKGATRVSLSTYQAPAVYIPQWLLKVGAGTIFPGMLRELEQALTKPASQRS